MRCASLALLLILAGCGGRTASVEPSPSVADGQLSATNHPQVAAFTISLPAGASVAAEFGPDTTYGLRTWAQPAPAGGGAVTLLVAGMKPFSTYHVRGVVQTAAGQFVDLPDHVFTTSGLAAALAPQFKVTRAPGAAPNAGVELFDLVVPNGQILAGALDLDGNLIWHYRYDPSLGFLAAIRPEFNGNVALTIGTRLVREIDLAGNTVREISADELNARLAAAGFHLAVSGFHHDVLPLRNGHLLVLCETLKDFNAFAGIPGTTTVRGDAVIDLDANWTPVWTWSGFDHLDVNRHPMDVQDWTHSNALVYSASDGDLLISMRNQHWVLKIDYADGRGSGAVLWRLGVDGDFTLTNGSSPLDWFYGQHLPTYVGTQSGAQFSLAMFDNRAISEDGAACATTTAACYSRPLVIAVDEAARTAAIAWQRPLDLYSLWGGNAQVLANRNIEFTLSQPFGNAASRTVELSPDFALVWQLDIVGQLAYRAYRIPSLYPGVQR